MCKVYKDKEESGGVWEEEVVGCMLEDIGGEEEGVGEQGEQGEVRGVGWLLEQSRTGRAQQGENSVRSLV